MWRWGHEPNAAGSWRGDGDGRGSRVRSRGSRRRESAQRRLHQAIISSDACGPRERSLMKRLSSCSLSRDLGGVRTALIARSIAHMYSPDRGLGPD